MARKILLADDSVTAQNMGRKILADAGYEVIAVNNGSAALKKIAEIKPDLVVLDVYMPGYSGLEVCQRLKESHETARIPVLLTVGKLEPFKPEEAQRVRAEAFIVKPFEASELLSALSKLEDKVVPRAEPSRPGRFARAFAAVEESGRVRAGEDTGWKNRISFPHEKTEAEKKAENLDRQSSTYNPVNRDLRTIVETPQEKTQEQADQRNEEEKSESSGRDAETVDIAALAPSGVPFSGLPKDVTQEELAAITSAAAQIQVATAALGEEQRASETASHAGPQPALETVGFEPPVREIDPDAPASPIVEPPAAASESEVPGTQHSKASDSQDSKESQDVPVTMAATADSVANSGASRWTAVAVALEGDEAALLLEHEMQRASAALEVSSADSAVPVNAVSETPLPSAEFSGAAPVPEISQELAKAPEAAPAAREGPVECSVERSVESAPWVAAQPDAAPTTTTTMDAPVAPERAIDSVEPESTPVQQTDIGDAAPVAQNVPNFEAAVSTQAPVEFAAPVGDGLAAERSATEFSRPASETESAPEYSIAPQEAEPESVAETTQTASGYRAFRSRESGGESASESAGEPNNETQAQPTPDNETVKSTAAAWASWRQIRDAGKAEASQDRSKEFDATELTTAEANAAAVAAGAEHSMPSAANSEQTGSSSDVASIVDSVLADLRPKLMKEISRKMAEKK